MSEHEIVCFHCGQSVGDPPRLNRVGDDEPCRACAERMLESLPGIFHAPFEVVVEGQDAAPEAARVDPEPRGYDDAGSI